VSENTWRVGADASASGEDACRTAMPPLTDCTETYVPPTRMTLGSAARMPVCPASAVPPGITRARTPASRTTARARRIFIGTVQGRSRERSLSIRAGRTDANPSTFVYP
jgi:hypothetical protein